MLNSSQYADRAAGQARLLQQCRVKLMRYMTDVRSDLDELLLQTVDRCCRFRIGWHLTSHLAQPESKGSDLLENAVVQISRDAHPLRLLRFDHLFVQRANLGLCCSNNA